jgi:hypothetical protein
MRSKVRVDIADRQNAHSMTVAVRQNFSWRQAFLHHASVEVLRMIALAGAAGFIRAEFGD